MAYKKKVGSLRLSSGLDPICWHSNAISKTDLWGKEAKAKAQAQAQVTHDWTKSFPFKMPKY